MKYALLFLILCYVASAKLYTDLNRYNVSCDPCNGEEPTETTTEWCNCSWIHAPSEVPCTYTQYTIYRPTVKNQILYQDYMENVQNVKNALHENAFFVALPYPNGLNVERAIHMMTTYRVPSDPRAYELSGGVSLFYEDCLFARIEYERPYLEYSLTWIIAEKKLLESAQNATGMAFHFHSDLIFATVPYVDLNGKNIIPLEERFLKEDK